MNIKTQKSEAYQKDAPFDFDNSIMLHYYPQRIISILETERKHTTALLELGLGHGYSAEVFSEYYDDYTIIDADDEVIRQFRKRNPLCKAKIIQSYFENYTCEREYDVIVMGFVLEHVENPLMILNMYKKYLSYDGRIFVTVPNAECMHRRLGKYAGDLTDLYRLSEADINLGHRRYFSKKSIESVIEEAGLNIIRVEGVFLKPLSTRQMISLSLDRSYINALLQMGVLYPELSAAILIECC